MEEQRRARAGIPLGRVAGVPVNLTVSWVFLAILLTITYRAYLSVERPSLPDPVGYVVGGGLVLCLLASVLLHELGHALVARHFGIGVRGITLQLLGGFTELDREAPSPRVELLVSLAGPAVSFLLGVGSVLAAFLMPSGTLAEELARQLAFSNIVVALFNALPGLPLDGGRALRAGIWAVSHDRHLGDRVAGWTGRLVAVGSVVTALVLYRNQVITVFGAVLVVLVALTLWSGAGQAIRSGQFGPRVPMLRAGELARPILAVPPDTPLAEALRRLAESGGDPRPVLGMVNSSGQLLGLVDETAAALVPVDRRPWVTVETVARQLRASRVLSADLAGEALIDAVRSNPAGEYVVAVGEDVLGVLRVADVIQVLESRGRAR